MLKDEELLRGTTGGRYLSVEKLNIEYRLIAQYNTYCGQVGDHFLLFRLVYVEQKHLS